MFVFSGLILAALTAWTAGASAQPPQETTVPRGVPLSLELLQPEVRVSGVEEAASPENAGRFTPIAGQDVHLGYTDREHWFRFTVDGATADPLVLNLSNSQLIDVTLYAPVVSGGFTEQAIGVAVPFWSRPLVALNPAFPIEVAQGQSKTFYMRIYHYGAMRFRAELLTADVAREEAILRLSLNLLLAGALIGLALYHGCIFVGLRQPVYLWLSLMLLATTLNQMTFAGTANMLLWHEPTRWGNHALTLTGITCQGLGVAFSMSFLQSWKHTPRLAWAAIAFVIFGTGVGFLTLAGHPIVFYGVIAYVLLGPVIMGALAIQAGWRSPVALGLFLASWGFVLVGEVLFCMVYLDLLRDNPFTANFMHVATLGASLVWSFSLTRQIKTNAQRQSELLERRVAERTAELETALSEVKTLEGLLPVCSNCKKIRDDAGAWHAMETYVSKHTGADFSHGICPDCVTELYPEYDRRGKEG
ncbi:MAG: hypothetical protein JNK74_24960 [Candidatus Hydrogenedentes bacterium]|nr:hypothetical protein [Candidatus Hydrogenedentota bacterium]